MAVLGTVVAINGNSNAVNQVIVVSANGTKRTLHLNDTLQSDETVITPPGVIVEVQLSNGRVMDIFAEQTVKFTLEFVDAMPPSTGDSAIDQATIQTVIKAINEGKDIGDVLEETAAGVDGAGGSTIYGFDFVNLLRIVERLNPLSLQFDSRSEDQLTIEPALLDPYNNSIFPTSPDAKPSTPPANLAPSAIAVSVAGNEDAGSVAFALAGTDSDGTVVSYRVTTLPTAAQGILYLADGVTPVTTAMNLTPAQAAALKFVPAPDFNGTVSIPFTATDNAGVVSSPANVIVTINAVNDTPSIAAPANLAVTEDVATKLTGISFGDVDAGTGNITVTLTVPAGTLTAISGAGVTVGGTATALTLTGTLAAINTFISTGTGVSYQTALNANGSVNLTVNINDNGNTGIDPGLTGTATNEQASVTIPINITPVNDAPVANPDIASTPIDTPLNNINVKANDTDVDNTNAQLTVSSPSLVNPALGTVTVNPDGTLNFIPASGVTGPVVINYTITDPGGLSSTATLTVNVGSNTLPNSADITKTFDEDTTLVLTPSDFAFIDPDTNASLTNVRIDNLPVLGALKLNGVDVTAGQVVSLADIQAGKLTYTPALNENGSNYANFNFSVQDNLGAFDTAPNTITFNVTPVNDAPAGTDKTITTNEDSGYTFTAGDFGFTDPNDTPANALQAVIITTIPTNGSLTLSGVPVTAGQSISAANIGNLIFTPAANANGTGYANFTFQVVDNGGTANGGQNTDQSPNTININITAVNDAPVNTLPVSYTTNEDTSLKLSGLSVADVDAASGTITVTLSVVSGTLTAATAGSVTVTGSGTTSITLTGTLANINTYLSTVANQPTYVPVANANGTVALTMTTNDGGNTGTGGALTDTDTININITAVNDPPVANADTGAVNEDATLTVTAANGVIQGTTGGSVADTDVDNATNTLVVSGAIAGTGAVTQGVGIGTTLTGVYGTLTLNADGSYSYVANNANAVAVGVVVQDVFSYTVKDPSNAVSNKTTLTINVTGTNDAPVANNGTATGLEDAASIPVTLTATDIDGTIASFNLSSLPTNGALYLDAAMTILVTTGTDIAATGNALTLYFKPQADFNSGAFTGSITPSFNFTAKDNNGAVSATATETITVTPVNDGTPVAVNDAFKTLAGTPITFTRAQLLANDTLFDHATITANGVLPTGVTYDVATQTYTYNPAAAGSTSFTYTITDDDGQTSTATVNLQAFNSRDDLGTVNESALSSGTGGGATTSTGNLFTNDAGLSGNITAIAAGANTTIVSNTVTAGIQTVVTSYGTLVVNQATGAYTYTLNNKVDNDSQTGATTNDFVETFTYTRIGGTANLVMTITDDTPSATNSIVQVPQTSTLTNYNLVLMLDISGSMDSASGIGQVRIVDANGNAALSTRYTAAKQAMIDMVTKYFNESASVTVKVGYFSGAATAGTTALSDLTSVINAINAIPAPGGGTNYEDALYKIQDMFGTVDTTKTNISYFISDGVPSSQVGAGNGVTDPANETNGAANPISYTTFLANNPSVKSYAIGIGGGVSDPAALNSIHNVDADSSNVKDPAILISDLNGLSAALLGTIPPSFGGTVGATGSNPNVRIGADGGFVQYIDMLLDSNDVGTVPDTIVRFTYNPTTNQITYDPFYQTGVNGTTTVTGNILTLNASIGFTKGTLVFNFTTGDYSYYTQGAAVSGDQFDISYSIKDNDGDVANAIETIQIINGIPRAYNDYDTLLPKNTFFDGNVMNAVSTDGAGQAVTPFAVGAGTDNAVDNAKVSSIVFNGATFNLNVASSGTLGGGTYTINAAKELTWTSSTDATNTLVFHSDGYYKYTPPSSQTSGPAQGAQQTVNFTTQAVVNAAGITLLGAGSTANLNTASAANVDYTNATGVGVISGAGTNARIDNLETLIINFNAATYAQGVQNVSLNINAAGSNLTGGTGTVAAAVSVFDILGNLLGQVSISSEGLVALPTNWSNIGSIRIEPNQNASILLDGVVFNPVTLNAAAVNIPDTVIGYTLTDAQGDTSSANLTLHIVTNEIQGTTAVDTITGTAGNDAISGFAGNDTLNGGAGSDVIKGGDGDDTINGGADSDQLYGGAGNDTIDGGTGDDLVYGDAGNDIIIGNDGNDTIYGGAGNDNINGGNGNDIISGGAGTDTLTGGAGSDIFKWELADAGVKGAPTTDTLTDFNTAAAGAGGDVLDFRDLLQGENRVTGAGNLASYLHFEKSGADTIVHISANGEYGAGFNATKDVQTITLTGVDLVTGFANDQAIIQNLLTNNKLVVD